MTSTANPEASGPAPEAEGGRVPVTAPRRVRRGLLGPADLTSLRLWVLTRVTVFVLASAGAWLLADNRNATRPVDYLDRWMQWDTVHYVAIARWGYDGNPATDQFPPLEAFFPGLPLALRFLHLFGVDYVAAGLVVSFVAGGFAVVALGRLAALDAAPGTDPDAVASRTVLLFLLAPSAIFLAACYTEALFLGFAIPAWLAARRGRWALAGALAAGASCVRVTGLFLAAALVVEFLTADDGRRRWRAAPALAVPFLPLLAYVVYLHDRTGDWKAWQHAQEEGWNRHFSMPWDAFAVTWRSAFNHEQATIWAWSFGAEIVAAIIGVLLTVWLVRRRSWGEAVYVGLQVVAFTTSSFFFSVPRATLLWWPLWIALANWSLRRPAVLQGYLAGIAPFMIVFTLLFTMGANHWAG